MECKDCGMDGFIDRKVLGFEGDESPDTETKAFYQLTYICRNRQCKSFGKNIGEEKVYLD